MSHNILSVFQKAIFLFLFLLATSLTFSQSYLGVIIKQVNFREGPGTDYSVIKSLKPGATVFITSLNEESDFYNVIDVNTDLEGYVNKQYIKVGKQIKESDGSFISASGNSSADEAEAKIYNNTTKTMTLKLNEEVYKFNPHETKNIVLTPGIYSFRASAPNVIPNVGKKNFEVNSAYSWEFYIVTTRR
jgi:uncharacterized protein YgiM (DUF1202 family)